MTAPAAPAASNNPNYRFFGLSEALSWLAQFEGQN